MTDGELRQLLKRREYGQMLLFCGEEEYLKRHYVRELRKALVTDETLAVFNHLRFEGAQLDLALLAEAVETPPMMADYKLIEWHLPHIDRMKDEELEGLLELAQQVKAAGCCCLLLVVDGADFDTGNLPKRPSKRYRQLSEAFPVVAFSRQEGAALATWVGRHLAHEGVTADLDVPRLLIQRVGSSMDTLAGEIDKLVCYAKATGQDHITADAVDKITAATVGDDAFGLANALLARQPEEAYRQLADLRRRRVEPTVLLGSVARTYAQMIAVCELRDEGLTPALIAKKLGMHEYRLTLTLRALQGIHAEDIRYALDACRRLDLSAKSGGMDTFIGIERLIAEMSCQ